MPKVHTQKAAKDYPKHGIKKGDTYYSWSFRYGGTYKSLTRPKPSQLTQSKLSSVYAAIEDMEENVAAATSIDDISEALNTCAESVGEVAQEYRDGVENMISQEGAIAQESIEKADNLDEFKQELEDAATEVDNLSASDYVDRDGREQAIRDTVADEMNGASEDDIEARVDELLEAEVGAISSFEDLDENEQKEMLDAAREIAGGPSCPV